MTKGRLEAFSDGVIAIIITIMVLELKQPHGTSWEALRPLIPVFISYILSFVMVAIYWNNHHHLLHAVTKVNGRIMWANMHLLFWLSLVPFVTAWVGENNFAPVPIALFGIVLMMAGLAYYLLAHSLVVSHGRDSVFAQALGRDLKGIASVVLYLIGIVVSFFSAWSSFILYVAVALIWIIPDRRFTKIKPLE